MSNDKKQQLPLKVGRMRESNPIYIYSFFFFWNFIYIYIYILFLVKVFASEIRLRIFVALVLLVTASRYHCLLGWLYLDHSNQNHGYQTFCLVPLLHTQRKNIYIYITWAKYSFYSWILRNLPNLLNLSSSSSSSSSSFFLKLKFNFFPYVLLISKY